MPFYFGAQGGWVVWTRHGGVIADGGGVPMRPDAASDPFHEGQHPFADAAIGAALVATDGQFIAVNPALCAFLDREEHALTSMTWAELTHPADVAIDRTLTDQVARGEISSFRLTKRYLRPDGTVVWGELFASGCRQPDGTLRHYLSQVVDVTDDIRRRESLAKSEQAFRMLVENSADVVLHTRAGVIEWASPSLTRVLGWETDDWTTRRLADFLHPDDLPGQRAVRPRILSGEAVHTRTRVRARAGTYHWVDVSAAQCLAPDGTRDGIVSSGRLADHAVALESELRRIAERDSLTGVLKRSQIVLRLEAEVGVVRPDGSHCGVLFIDIDRLKQVNDRLGHPAGDELLRILASRIEHALPADAEVGRFGGDEFLAIAAGIDHVGLAELAEQVRAALAESTLLDGLAVSPSASIGATLERAGEDADSLIRRVDGLMYEAKRLGGDGVVVRG